MSDSKKFLWDEEDEGGETMPNTAVTGEANLHSGSGSGHGYGNDGMATAGIGDDNYYDKRTHTMNPIVAVGSFLCTTPTGKKISLGVVVVVALIVIIATSVGGNSGSFGSGNDSGISTFTTQETKRYEIALDDIMSYDIVSEDVLQDSTSAHHKALVWIAKYDEAAIDPYHLNFMSRYMIATLYFATIGKDIPSANVNGIGAMPSFHNWMTSDSVCDWYGITCVEEIEDDGVKKDKHGSIRMIDLKESELEGTLPAGFESLNDLTKLDLSSNDFTGTIPSTLLDTPNIQDVFLRINNFSGKLPATIGNDNCQLRQLFLDYSKFFFGVVLHCCYYTSTTCVPLQHARD